MTKEEFRQRFWDAMQKSNRVREFKVGDYVRWQVSGHKWLTGQVTSVGTIITVAPDEITHTRPAYFFDINDNNLEHRV